MSSDESKDEGGTVKISFLELLALNEIRIKQQKYKLEMADEILSILKRASQCTLDTSVDTVEEIQSQLRAMLNKTEQDLKSIDEDKKFLENIIKRSEEKVEE